MNSKDKLDTPSIFNANNKECLSEDEKARQEKILKEYVGHKLRPVISELEKKKNKE